LAEYCSDSSAKNRQIDPGMSLEQALTRLKDDN
jgi:hypothetical protein